MANTKQSEKRARQNTTRRLRGQALRSRCRTMVKKARAAVAGDADAFRAAFMTMQSVADRAAGKKQLHRNTVARLKRRINRLAKAAKVSKSAEAKAA